MQSALLGIGFGVIITACHHPTPAAPAPANPTMVAIAARLDKLLVASPSDGALLYQRASLVPVIGDPPAEALPYLERLDATGWSHPLAGNDFEPIAGDPRYVAIAARIAARSHRVSASTVAVRVPVPDLIPEGIACDPASPGFYLGSMHKRSIIAIDAAGVTRTVVAPRTGGAQSVLGIKVDAARGVVWAASHNDPAMEDYREGTDQVISFAIADGSVRRTVSFPAGEPHGANDLAVASDGTVYVTDMIGGAVYRIPPDRDVLELVVPLGTFIYPNGLALLDDRQLYVGDALGIALVALAGAAPTAIRLTAPAGIALGGIDGMVVVAGHIYGVQNGIGEPRVVAIAIEGTRALSLDILENDPAALAIPTTTCLRDRALYTIANTNLGAITAKGLAPGRTLSEPRIVRTPLP